MAAAATTGTPIKQQPPPLPLAIEREGSAAAPAEPVQQTSRRGGRGRRKQQQQQVLRNRRKPIHGSRGDRGTRSSGQQNRESGNEFLPSPAESVLRHMMSGRFRRWVMYEWHYSAIDRPYFMRNEMQELLDATGLGHVTHLTGGEWSIVRSAFGRPRRVSLAFLKQERGRLNLYRERVRAAYEAAGGNEVPPDLPRPLKVGQQVVARHPATGSLHDGIILTIKANKYRVQFNRSELMTEVVRDTEVMPLEPSENLPLNLLHTPPLLNGRPTPAGAVTAGQAGYGLGPTAASFVRRRQLMQLGHTMATGQRQQQHQLDHPVGIPMQNPRVDHQLLGELSGALDRKEELLSKLRAMNTTAEGGSHIDPSTGRPAEPFQASYAAVLTALQAVNTELQGLTSRLQSRSHLQVDPQAVAASAAALKSLKAPAQQQPVVAAAAAAAALGRAASGPGSMCADVGASAANAANTVAAALVKGATAEACSVVQRIRAQQQQPGALVADGHKQPQEASQLDDTISGCISMLVTVHRLTSPPGVGQPQLAPAAIEAALDAVLQQLRPQAASNSKAFADIVNSVRLLKAQLTKAH
eukprot:GHRR01012295.1.p1 GENE.GHRR01012295.1~~GHRR01012295.1.p1  ORF type:complete len:583 (+),score=258.78 GHRR01012295.1:822-2570(+)